MTIRDQVIALLAQAEHTPSDSLETDTVEFKHYASENALHNAKDLPEEISALSNHKGGLIIIGVRDSSNVSQGSWNDQLTGFSPVDVHTTRERLRGKLKPFLDIELEQIDHEGKNYLVVQVPHKRDSLVATASGKVCIRDGKSSRPMTPDEIKKAVKNLQDYDWSAELLELTPDSSLNEPSVVEALTDFCQRREIEQLDRSGFLEAIGATENGMLTKSGLLFLGKSDIIHDQLGVFEYRFSRKTSDGRLLLNEIWQDCLWETIKRSKAHFDQCNHIGTIEFKGEKYSVQFLDRIAFHEAYLNALVHRDYSVDGMVSVNFTGKTIIITSPGRFYGGVTAENIAKHEPRHRNKALARMLMQYHLVDRAGMGVFRMCLNSLRYGRAFPEFKEGDDFVEVSMEGEYLRPSIFVLAAKETKFGIPELLILNSVYHVGVIPVGTLKRQLAKVVDDPWRSIEAAMENLSPIVELCGTRAGIFVRAKPEWNEVLEITKAFKITPATRKHVMLYRYLADHGSASNADIKAYIGLKYTSQTSAFLKSASYVRRTGRGPTALWSLAD